MTDQNVKPEPPPSAQAAPTAGSGGVVLDANALADLRKLDPSGASRLLPRVLTAYRKSLAKLLSQMAHARQQSDAATIRRVTHTLKSSSASIGALAFSALCGEAEMMLREGRLERLPALLDQLVAEAARVDAAVLQLLADH